MVAAAVVPLEVAMVAVATSAADVEGVAGKGAAMGKAAAAGRMAASMAVATTAEGRAAKAARAAPAEEGMVEAALAARMAAERVACWVAAPVATRAGAMAEEGGGAAAMEGVGAGAGAWAAAARAAAAMAAPWVEPAAAVTGWAAGLACTSCKQKAVGVGLVAGRGSVALVATAAPWVEAAGFEEGSEGRRARWRSTLHRQGQATAGVAHHQSPAHQSHPHPRATAPGCLASHSTACTTAAGG